MAHACRFRRCYRKASNEIGGVDVRTGSIRVLVTIEETYLSYRETIAACIHILRPHVEVATASLEALEEQIKRFDPHVVLCTLPTTASCGGRVAWVELSLEPLQPSVICIAGCYSQQRNLDLHVLLEVIDNAERLVQNLESPAQSREKFARGKREQHKRTQSNQSK